MAIHHDLPGIEVSVCMNGENIKEYQTKSDKADHCDTRVVLHQTAWAITNFIEAIEDNEFSVKISIQQPFQLDCSALSFELTVDGEWIDTEIMDYIDYKDGKYETEMAGLLVETRAGHILKPLKFAKIKIDPERGSKKAIKKHMKLFKAVGEIELQIDRRAIIKNSKKKGSKYKDMDDLGVDYTKTYQEKPLAKSGKTHGSTFGTAKAAGGIQFIHTKTIDGDDYPLVIFKFKYRSRESLQALTVIPRSLEPEHEDGIVNVTGTRLDLGGFTPAQRVTLQRLFTKLEIPGFKREGTPLKREACDNIKSRSAKKSKRITIDLTGQDSD